MRIAVNTRFLLSRKMEGFGWYTQETVQRLVEKHPEHTFIFFFDRPYEERFIFGKNVVPVILSPPARHPLLFIWWFEVAVTRALKKYRADVFLSPDGFLSLRSDVPQIPVIHDLNFEHYPQDLPWSARVYLRRYFPKFAKKAKKIVTVSHYSKQDLVKTYGIDPARIQVGWNGVSEEFKPLGEEEKAAAREQYAQNNPYFLFVGALHPRKNIGRLFEAFESYRQQGGNYHLVVVGENLWKNNRRFPVAVTEETRKRIHFTGHLPLHSLTKVMGGASCLVFVPYFEGFGIPLVEAMRCAVPIISGNLTSLPEVAGEAALFVNPFDVPAITRAMRKISSDPHMQKQLSILGLERSRMFSWDKTADVLWETILEVYSENKASQK